MPFGIGPGEIVIVLSIAAIVAAPILLLVFLARGSARPAPSAPGPDPRAVLADRLARGQITHADFETAMRALGLVERRD